MGVATAQPQLEVVFRGAVSGWVHFDVLPLTAGWRVQGTHIDSPFGHMLRWLEAIADGADMARWAIEGEWRSTEFVYLVPARHCITRPRPLLLAIDVGEDGDPSLAHAHVEPVPLVRAFYESFRCFAESTYDPYEWEYGAHMDPEGDSVWEGEPLRSLRSLKVEEVLRPIATEQYSFDLRFPRS